MNIYKLSLPEGGIIREKFSKNGTEREPVAARCRQPPRRQSASP